MQGVAMCASAIRLSVLTIRTSDSALQQVIGGESLVRVGCQTR